MTTIKVYGMDGLIEWHGTVKYGEHSMSVAFTNGGATAFGVNPATFTTSDSLTQYVIENCDKFKEGRIKIVRKIELPGEDDTEKEEQSNNVAKKQEEAEKPAEAPVTAPNETEAEDSNAIIFKANSNDDAKDYLAETFGVNRSKMRSRKSIEDVAKENGVTIEWV